MKTSAEKSSTTTSAPALQEARRPFFVRAGEGDFIASRRPAIVPATRAQTTVRNVQTPARTVIPPKRQKDGNLQKQGDEKNREKPTPEEKLPHKSGEVASGKPHEQPIATHSTSESGHQVQPISNIADSRSPANIPGEAESAAAR